MADSGTVIAASPNCFLAYSTFTAYGEFPALGIHHVEVPASPGGAGGIVPEVMNADDVQRFKDRLTKIGVTPVSVGIYCNFLDHRQVAAALRRIDFAEALGAPVVVSDATRKLEVDDDEWRRLVNALRYAGDYAADHGVKIALETHGGLTRNGSLAAKLLSAVDHPAVGVNYDTGNIYYYNEGLDPVDDIKLVSEKVFQVHLKDTIGGKGEWLFCPLGEGRVNFPGVVETLKKAGFKGAYSLELEGKRGEDLNLAGHRAVIKKSVDYLRSIGLLA